jgi:IclR family KDG regulon transcriptional repressor
MLNTVKKIGPVLDLFTAERPEWRMSDIARALDMPKSSAHSLVATLAEIGLLSRGSHGRYRLGWNLLSLSERLRSSLEFREHALPHMQELSRTLKETILLAVLDRHEVVYVERAEGRHPMVRLAGVSVGARIPAHCTAVGKMLLAHRDIEEVRALMSHSGMRAMTARTITTFDELQGALVEIRTQGVAFDLQEVVADVACAAVPITDSYGSVIAAMSVSMPAYRFPAQRGAVVAPLKAAAMVISERIAAAEVEREAVLAATAPVED